MADVPAHIAKVESVRDAFEYGATVRMKANSARGWSATAQAQLERAARQILRVVLDREPTADEIAVAMGDDDPKEARERMWAEAEVRT